MKKMSTNIFFVHFSVMKHSYVGKFDVIIIARECSTGKVQNGKLGSNAPTPLPSP